MMMIEESGDCDNGGGDANGGCDNGGGVVIEIGGDDDNGGDDDDNSGGDGDKGGGDDGKPYSILCITWNLFRQSYTCISADAPNCTR